MTTDAIGAAQCRLREDPGHVREIFPAIGRQVGCSPWRPAEDPDGLIHGRLDERARARLVLVLAELMPAEDLAAELTGLYHRGTVPERSGVLRGLSLLLSVPPGVVTPSALGPAVVAAGRALHEDALRTDDPVLVAAAMGRFAARYLDRRRWRQAVLKCLSLGVPPAAVAELPRRVDAQLVRLVRDFVAP